MKRRVGPLESRALAWTQMRGVDRIRGGDLVSALRLTPTQENELLSRLARSGMIARVRRGLYLVPPRLPLGGEWTPDETLALNALVEDRQGRYQICGPSAFSRYGLDEQVPGPVYAYNNRLSGERSVGAVEIVLIKTADQRLGDTDEVRMPSGQTAVYSSRTRSLVDAVYDWSRFGTLPRAYDWIAAEISAERVAAARLIDAAVRYGNQGTIRRIASVLERAGIARATLAKLERALRSGKSLIELVPGRPRRGTVDGRWGVIVND